MDDCPRVHKLPLAALEDMLVCGQDLSANHPAETKRSRLVPLELGKPPSMEGLPALPHANGDCDCDSDSASTSSVSSPLPVLPSGLPRGFVALIARRGL